MSNQTERQILLTGATGFLGKVVLWELLRRQGLDSRQRIAVVVRGKAGQSGAERFRRKVLGSDCWRGLPEGTEDRIDVIDGDLEQERFGLDSDRWRSLAEKTGTLIHCAASIDFHLPVARAERANVGSALEVLALAKRARAERFVAVSTAYATPHPGEGVAVEETLAALPYDPETLRREIREGRYDEPDAEAALLQRTGHPNTYTLTKCIAEHLLTANAGDVPLTIVRPSIISASWRWPLPGWIDSPAAFAMLAVMVATGRMRVLMGMPETRLDLVPVDIVANRILEVALTPARGTPQEAPRLVHAVAGIERSPRIDQCARRVVSYFRTNPPGVAGATAPRVQFIGPDGPLYRLWHWRTHCSSPHTRAIATQIAATSRQFSYFTTRSFDFRSSLPFEDPDFDASRYLDLISQGIGRHLLAAPSENSSVPEPRSYRGVQGSVAEAR